MKIDWTAAKKDYITDETLSYEDIAKKYGLATQSVAARAGKDGWVEQRKKALSKIDQKLIEKATDIVAEFQAKKLKVGQAMVAIGLQGIQAHPPRSARESKEVVDSGYKIATEAMGLDKPQNQINIQNNTFMSIADFGDEIIKAIEVEKQADNK